MAPTPEIGLYGGMALLISSITGPGLTTIPLLFQQAGWFTPTLAFLLFGLIALIVSLFLVETMSTIHGNEAFQAKVEYSTVAHLYLGRKAHMLMQVLLFFALQSVNISSMVISEQTIDSLLIRLFHKTCAVSFTEGWTCASEINPSGSPFTTYILFSLGYIISALMVIPLSMMSLVQNIKFQLVSVIALFFVMVCWTYIFISHGLDQSISAIGNDQSSLVGFVLNNFAFITTVPSFINELSRQVSIHRVISYPLVICVATYLIIGLLGAASFKIADSTDILATLSASDTNKVLVIIVNIVFPISVLVTSIPVFAIVIRYNLVRGNLCSNRQAIVLASVVPWILIIPFQTKGWLVLVMNWTALIFGSTTNFIIPLVLYILSKTHSASTINATGGDVFVLRRSASTSTERSRRSLHLFNIPRIIIPETPPIQNTTEEAITSSPLVVIHPPSTPPEISNRPPSPADNDSPATSPTSPSNLDPNLDPNLPLRIVYSPSVSRSGSISTHHTDRPSITLDAADPDPSTPKKAPSPPPSPSRLRASSIDLRPTPSSSLHRRARSRGISLSLPTPPAEESTFAPPTRSRTLSIEERAPPLGQSVVFRAFKETKWWRGVVVAWTVLGIVVVAVGANLVYTTVATAQGKKPLSD